jgi:hypothetical protein
MVDHQAMVDQATVDQAMVDHLANGKVISLP